MKQYIPFVIGLLASSCSMNAFAQMACVNIYKENSIRATVDLNKERLRNDFLRALQLRQIDPSRTVTLALGRQDKALSLQQKRLIRQLVSKIKQKGYMIIYDADSSAAPVISEIAGQQGIGISGVPGRERTGAHLVVVIENISLRMDAFLFRYNDVFQPGHRMIVDLESMTGIGLLLQNHPQTMILDVSRSWRNQLQQWVQSLGQKAKDLHLAEPPTPEHLTNAKDLAAWTLDPVVRNSNNHLKPSQKTTDVSQEDLQLATRYAEDIISGESKGITNERGAVVFCSAVGDPQSNGALIRLASLLAERHIPVVTGGSIATMELVNQAAKDAGGVSIGIPIRRPPGHIEFVVPEHAHTLTQLVDAHPARLHFLLNGRDLIFIGPGGKGIIKEIGATFIKLAAFQDMAKFPKIVLVDRYYQGLKDFIEELPLPEKLKKKIVLLPVDQVNSESIGHLIRSSNGDQ